MGQYHVAVNLDKRQYLDPHKLGDGLKLMEFGMSGEGGTMTALALLLASSNGRGGGDCDSESPLIGSWAGDRIAILGDYSEPEDIPGLNAEAIYDACKESGEYADITADLREVIAAAENVKYTATPITCKNLDGTVTTWESWSRTCE